MPRSSTPRSQRREMAIGCLVPMVACSPSGTRDSLAQWPELGSRCGSVGDSAQPAVDKSTPATVAVDAVVDPTGRFGGIGPPPAQGFMRHRETIKTGAITPV